MRKVLISIFVVLNLTTVLVMNRPVIKLWTDLKNLDQFSYTFSNYYGQYVIWLVRRYAYLTGLDNRWEMFGYLHRFNWWYVITATYEGEEDPQVLPLPLQSVRSVGQRLFSDFKEPKFHLNMYHRPYAREAYARYLCREYPIYKGRQVRGIQFELNWQGLKPLEEAVQTGEHLYPLIQRETVNTFSCPGGEA